jgi:hypothetical protein
MANYAGNWQLGSGMSVAFDSVTYADPLRVQLPEVSVFQKDLTTLAGTTALVGKKRNSLGMIGVTVAGYADGTLVAEPPTSGTLTITWPDGTAKSCTAFLVSDAPGEATPEAELTRVIMFKPIAVLA